jgi:hypothetical protein
MLYDDLPKDSRSAPLNCEVGIMSFLASTLLWSIRRFRAFG